MTLREYMMHLNNAIAETPEILDMTVVAASDDEGNQFNDVLSLPTRGRRVGEYGFEDVKHIRHADCICIN